MKQMSIEHMNKDHLDIVEALCKKFGSLKEATNVKLIDLDEDGMSITCDELELVRVPFIKKANQNGEGYRHAIMEVCKDLEPNSNKLKKASENLKEFINECKSVIISSKNNDNLLSSYAPFVMKDDEIFIVISSVAPHYESMKENSLISTLFIQDESEAATIFARVRASFITQAHFSDDEKLRDEIFDLFEKTYPQDGAISHIRKMSDFVIVKLELKEGRFVRGFGAAYETYAFNILKQAGLSNPHKYKK